MTDTSSSHDEEVLRILGASGHFEVLYGISHGSSDDEVKRAYRTLALRTHPDKNKHQRAEEAFKRVHSAFQALETQPKRDVYHHRHGGRGFGASPEGASSSSPFGHSHGPFGGSEFDFFDMFMRQAMGGAARGGRGAPRGGISLDEMMMMMMMEQMMNGARGGFGGFGGHFHEEDDDFEEDYYEEEEEEEEEDDELEGVYYDRRNGMFICEGCGIEIKSEAALRTHIATEAHQNRYGDGDGDEEDDDDEEEEEADEERFDTLERGLTFNTSTNQYVCRTCDVVTKSRQQMESHVAGKKHRIEMRKEDFYCEACDVSTATKEAKQSHLQGKKHLRTMRSSYKG